MNKSRAIIFAETIIILGLCIYLISVISHPAPQVVKTSYCDKYMYEDKTCLLSPRIYTGILNPESYLVLNFKPLQEDLQNYIRENNLSSSVYVLNIRDSASFGINANEGFEPASLNKLPVAIIILRKVEKGELSLNTLLPINDYDRDNKSGPLYSNYSITKMTVKELLNYMLSDSDNTAFRVLEEQVTLEDLQGLSSYLNYYIKDISLLPNNNTYQITPKSTANLFMSLYLSTDLKPENSELILSLLANTSGDDFDLKKYANIPQSVIISEKYGSYYVGEEKNFHDCGIMYVKESRIFYCVMTKNLDTEKASNAIGEIVNKIYNYILNKENKTE